MFASRRTTLFRFTARRPLLIFFLCGGFLFTFFSLQSWYQEYKLKDEIRRLQYEVRKLEHRRLETLDILSYVMSDAYVSEAARTELNMALPGEAVAVLQNASVSSSTKTVVLPISPSSTDRVLSNVEKWWYYFLYHSLSE